MKPIHFVSADEAVSHIPSHCHIHLSSVASVPYAHGDLVSLDKFDFLVQDDAPLVTANFAEPTPTETIIGKNCAALVEDGDCIRMGIGALPNALAAQLGSHKNLGLHTEMLDRQAFERFGPHYHNFSI